MTILWSQERVLPLLCRSFQGIWLVDTATGQCAQYDPVEDQLGEETHYDQWLVALGREMARADAVDFFTRMDLSHVCAQLDGEAEQCTVYRRLPDHPEEELTLFYPQGERHMLAVTRRILPGNRPGPLASADLVARANARLGALVGQVVEYFIEVDVHTGDCCVLHGERRDARVTTKLKELVTWQAEHLIAPEERESYRSEFELEHLKDTLAANGGRLCTTYTTDGEEHPRTLAITCQRYEPHRDGAYIYIYCTDISQYTEQERRNRQLVDISQQLRTLSQTDPLTNLYNRTAAEALIEEHLTSCWQEKAGTLILFDIDHFKAFNDTQGHQVGDFVLKFLGKSMQSVFRSDDILCRWGGDEFMVFMRDVTRRADVESRVQRLRARIQSCRRNDSQLHITVSCGGAVAHRGDRLKDLFGQCDQMLYAVKDRGRDGFLLYREGDRES